MKKPLPRRTLMVRLMRKLKLNTAGLASRIGSTPQRVSKMLNHPSQIKMHDTNLALLRLCIEINDEDLASRFLMTYTGGEVMGKNASPKPKARILPGR